MESYHHDPSMMTPSPVLPERLTPLMFSRPHVCARMSASGLLVKVEPNNPRDGQTATVEVHSISSLLRDSRESQELSAFPGPLKPGETHKNVGIRPPGQGGAQQPQGRSDSDCRGSQHLLAAEGLPGEPGALRLPRPAQAWRDSQERRDQVLRAEDFQRSRAEGHHGQGEL